MKSNFKFFVLLCFINLKAQQHTNPFFIPIQNNEQINSELIKISDSKKNRIELKIDSLINELTILKSYFHSLNRGENSNNELQFLNIDSSIFPNFPIYSNINQEVIDTSETNINHVADMNNYKTTKTHDPYREFKRQEANEKVWQGTTELLLNIIFGKK